MCDCDADEFCEADVLAGMVFELTLSLRIH